jgi:hypothetical protein
MSRAGCGKPVVSVRDGPLAWGSAEAAIATSSSCSHTGKHTARGMGFARLRHAR